MPSVAVYKLRGNNRSQKIGEYLAEGVAAAGDVPIVRMDNEYPGVTEDVAAFYGYEMNLPAIMKDYNREGRPPVYVDMGYWGRIQGGKLAGYHKIALGARHPTGYFMERPRDDRRIRALGITVAPWTNGGKHILLAGMSERAAESVGLRPEEWERQAITEIRKHTDRQIIYRPKPSWRKAKPIPGVGWSPQQEPLENALFGAWAVVTHHSNVAVDALVAGIPAFSWDGVARPMTLQDFSKIEKPWRPENREEWIRAISYCQWNRDEMRDGSLWRFLKDDGAVP